MPTLDKFIFDMSAFTDFASFLEKNSDRIVTSLANSIKRHMEGDRKEGRLKFRRIRRIKSGRRRFAAPRPPAVAAEPIPKTFQAEFEDIFTES